MDKVDIVLDNLKKKYHFSERELSSIKTAEEPKIPISIFSNRKLGPLESLTIYLKDKQKMRYSEIATHLNRDQRTIWVTYHNAKKKVR